MLNKEIQNQIDEVFQEYDTEDTPGSALGIVRDGALVYSRGYGMADLETHSPITADTVFHLASVSKQFTAVCIALLEEAGEISLRDPVTKYIPFLPEAARALHVGPLVYMTNGLEDFYDVTSFIMGIPEGNYFSREEAIRIIRAANWLKFAPGEQWSYGNTGYFLLACIIEQISGQPFNVFVKQHIFEPLGMADTFVRTDRFMEIPRRARGYARMPNQKGQEAASGEFPFQPQNELIEFGGAGQAWSTVNDLVKWELNFYDNRLGGKDSGLIDKMSRPGKLNDGRQIPYAYGQFIRERNGMKVIFHEGGAAGANTVIYRIPEKKLSIICLANTSDFLTALLKKLGEECYERVADILLLPSQKAVKPSEETERTNQKIETASPETSTEGLERLVGNYEDPASSYIWEVRLDGARVSVLENYAKNFSLEVGKDSDERAWHFHSIESGLSGTFCGSKEGPFTEIQVSQGEAVRTFERFLSLPAKCLEEYEGIYTCSLLNASYRVFAVGSGIRLENTNPANDLLNVVFTPTIRDMFLARYPPLIGWYVIHFKRDPNGKVRAFSFRDEVPGRERWVFERKG